MKCSTENHVPIVVTGLSTSSSSSATPTYPASVLQDAEHPASTRSEGAIGTVRVSRSHDPVENNKMETTRQYGETRCVIWKNGYKNVQRILWKKVFQLIGTHPRVLLVSQPQSREEKWCRGRTVFYTHFPKDRNCELCIRTKDDGCSLQKTHWRSRTSSRKFW